MSQLGCLQPEWPDLHTAAVRAEIGARVDPRASAFHARRCLEDSTVVRLRRCPTISEPAMTPTLMHNGGRWPPVRSMTAFRRRLAPSCCAIGRATRCPAMTVWSCRR